MTPTETPRGAAESILPRTWPQQSKPIFTFLNATLLFLLSAHIIRRIIASTNIFLGLLFMCLSLAPTFFFGRLILKHFRDPSVPNQFLLQQFLLSALPLIFLIIPLEIILIIVSLLPLTFVYHEKIIGELEGIEEAISTNEALKDDPDELLKLFTEALQHLFKYIPFWAIAVTLIAVAVLSAGTAEELGKWLVSRRYRTVEYEAVISGMERISARGILASACMSGLGFATIENIGYGMNIGSMSASTWLGIVGLAFVALFRGALAFAVHIGTQLYVAVTAAQKHLFQDDGSVPLALLYAILFHGLFDAIAFVTLMGTIAGKIPAWFSLIVPIIDLGLVIGLCLLVRSRYRALLDRERVLISTASEV
eukprot:GFKZ01012357.1.p1 GENE.GFKZ01012357.1~~GFKZ01012357.1.p1  ORF type:complete len:366 (-),score=25.27 GFKZ01012357.1:391-1488(-)